MDILPTNGLPMQDEAPLFKPVGKKELDRSDFMTLFITQLQYQDPMKPMDSYEMASQLAQFSNMEATTRMSENMEKLLDYQTSQNNLQLLTLLDKDVQAMGNKVAVSDGEVGRGEFTMPEFAASCRIDIYDAGGAMVDTINLGSVRVGTYDLNWNGEDSRGNKMEDGLYVFTVEALSETGQKIDVESRMIGKVTGIQFDSGKAELTLDNHIALDVGQVTQVM